MAHTKLVCVSEKMEDAGSGRVSKMDPPSSYPPLFGGGGSGYSVGTDDEGGSGVVVVPLQMPVTALVDVNPAWVVEAPPGAISAAAHGRHSRSSGSGFSIFSSRSSGGGGSNSATASVQRATAALAPLPHVGMEDFAGYLAQLRGGRASGSGSSARNRRGSSLELAAAAAVATAAAEAANGAGLTATPPPPLVLVPAIFFEPGFGAAESKQIIGSARARYVPPGDAAAAAAAVAEAAAAAAAAVATQEALTGHLDVIECHLLKLIRERSSLLFGALADIQDLRDSVAAAHVNAVNLQRVVERLRSECGLRPLAIIAATRRRQRMQAVAAVLGTLQRTQHAAVTVGALIAASDFAGALQLLHEGRAQLRVPELARVRASTLLCAQLDRYERVVGDTLVTSFVIAACTFTAVGRSAGPADDDDGGNGGFGADSAGGGGSESGAASDSARSSAAHLRASLELLVRTGRLGDALASAQASILQEVRTLVWTEVAELVRAAESDAAAGATASTTTLASASTDSAVLTLTAPAFLHLLRAVLATLSGIVQRTHSLHDLVERILDTIDPRSTAGLGSFEVDAAAAAVAGDDGYEGGAPPSAAASWASQRSSFRAASSGVVAAVAESAQRHVSALLARRREQPASAAAVLRVADVKAVWDAVLGFTLRTGAFLAQTAGGAAAAFASAAADGSPALAECLAQARALLSDAHRRNTAALSAMLDAEQWRDAEVPVAVQAIADTIADSIAATPLAGSASSAATTVASAAPAAAAATVATSAAVAPSLTPAARAPSPVLRVKGQAFHTAGTGIMLVKMLGDYCALAEAVPDVTAHAVTLLVELLRLFNARSAALVLGAGAVQTAGLRRITARHLAVAAQTLDALLALLPSIRGSLVMRLPPAQHVLLQELARVTADFMQHEQRILAKFVSIVRDLFLKCVADMRALPWGDASAAMAIPTPPMRELVKGIATLHRILLPLLRPDQLFDVICRVGNLLAAQAPPVYTALLASASAHAPASAAASAASTAAGAVPAAVFASALSRDVAAERMAADLRALCDALENIRVEDEGEAAAAEATTAQSAAKDADASRSAAAAPTAVLRAWVRRQFGEYSAPSSPVPVPPAVPPAAAAAAIGAAAPASADEELLQVTQDAEAAERRVSMADDGSGGAAADADAAADVEAAADADAEAPNESVERANGE